MGKKSKNEGIYIYINIDIHTLQEKLIKNISNSNPVFVLTAFSCPGSYEN